MKAKEFLIRSLTGLLIVVVTLLAIIYSPYTYLLFLGLIVFGGTLEFLRLDSLERWTGNGFLVSAINCLIILLTGYLLIEKVEITTLFALLPVLISVIIFIQLFVFKEPETIVKRGKSVYAAAAYIALPILSGTFFLARDYSYKYVLSLIILIWVNDVGAYLVGSWLGTKKISPSISPGKSLQGTIGGGLLTLAGSYLLYRIWPEINFSYLLIVGLATPFFALAGDLWESALKRNAGVKDSGKILPGHGGILDRYDSFLFMLPIAAVAYLVFAL